MNRLIMIIVRNILRLPSLTIRLYYFASHKEKTTKQQRYQVLRYIVERTKKTGNIKIQIEGKENIPQNQGAIFYPNHQGIFDGFAMVEACEMPFSPVIKQELMSMPFVKQLLECMDAMPMNREDIKQSMQVILEVIRRVNNGERCLIFPEGTRSKEGNKILEFKGGCFQPATKTKCPIVPVALINSFKPFDEKSIGKETVYVHILEPILYEEYKDWKNVQIANEVRDRIEQAIRLRLSESKINDTHLENKHKKRNCL